MGDQELRVIPPDRFLQVLRRVVLENAVDSFLGGFPCGRGTFLLLHSSRLNRDFELVIGDFDFQSISSQVRQELAL